ncbi:MAG: MlaA family lipoprotein [Pedosphaera sp.]|nr:MlaA family lipoprotein [Pedosphaera sp.]
MPAPSHPEDSLLMPATLHDPLEPVNRLTFALDKTLFTFALEPATRGYNAVLPEPARVGLKNFRNNLFYPMRLGNNLLQGKWSHVGIETKRFLINTTEGILGFGDPASHKYQLAVSDEDLGQTLGAWGWDSRVYLYVPILGASSGRDLFGRTGEVFMDPASLVPLAKMGMEFNLLSFDAKAAREILETELDPYELNKLFYTQMRKIQVTDSQPLQDSDDTAQTQTLMVIFSRPENPEFAGITTEHTVQPRGFRKPLAFSLWRQPNPAPIAFVLPGLGGHRKSANAMALAEIAHLEGYHVICFSNNFNWEFIQAAPKGFLPGYLNDDLKLIRQLQKAAHGELSKTLGADRVTGKPSIMGFSMGGWYTLNLAATHPPNTFDHALSINPPLDLNNGLKALDRLFRAPANDKNREAIKQSALLKILVNRNSTKDKGMVVPFSDIEASYLIGLTYRLILRQAILTSHEITPNRKVYNRINAISWEDYYQKIIKPRVKERNISPADLEAASDLRSREAGLMQAHGVHLVLTGNDFLLTDDHLAWFRDRFKNRTIYSETGGHMGHLWKKDVRDAMRAAIRQPAR